VIDERFVVAESQTHVYIWLVECGSSLASGIASLDLVNAIDSANSVQHTTPLHASHTRRRHCASDMMGIVQCHVYKRRSDTAEHVDPSPSSLITAKSISLLSHLCIHRLYQRTTTAIMSSNKPLSEQAKDVANDASRQAQDTASQAQKSAQDTAASAQKTAEDTANKAQGNSSSYLSQAQDAGSSYASTAGGYVSSALNSAGEMIGNAGRGLGETLTNAANGAEKQAQGLSKQVGEQTGAKSENPLEAGKAAIGGKK